MRRVDGNLQSNISATTSSFRLDGGLYAAAAAATWGGGSVKLQILLPDGSTYLSVASGTDFTANGFATVYLPKGTYRWTIATASAIYASVERVPGE